MKTKSSLSSLSQGKHQSPGVGPGKGQSTGAKIGFSGGQSAGGGTAAYSLGGGGGGYAYARPDYSALVNSLKSTLQDNLDKSLAARQQAYDNTKSLYDQNLAGQLSQLKTAYDFGAGKVNDSADASLREAYLNKMDNLRTLPQLLSAQGLTGGMTETTNAKLLNAYGSNRAAINQGRTSSLKDLLNTYSANTASAQQNYNTKLAEAYSALQQGIAADRAAYNQSLAGLMAYLG